MYQNLKTTWFKISQNFRTKKVNRKIFFFIYHLLFSIFLITNNIFPSQEDVKKDENSQSLSKNASLDKRCFKWSIFSSMRDMIVWMKDEFFSENFILTQAINKFITLYFLQAHYCRSLFLRVGGWSRVRSFRLNSLRKRKVASPQIRVAMVH